MFPDEGVVNPPPPPSCTTPAQNVVAHVVFVLKPGLCIINPYFLYSDNFLSDLKGNKDGTA